MNLDLYQTLEERNDSADKVEGNGPIKCISRKAWLGHGYYFWDGNIEIAHWWGQSDRYATCGYVICQANAILDSSCWDIHGNMLHIREFKKVLQKMVASKVAPIDRLTVPNVIEFLKKSGGMKYNSIRALGINSFSEKYRRKYYPNVLKFEVNLPAYLDLYPPVQLCLINKTALSLSNYRVVYPEYYSETYA